MMCFCNVYGCLRHSTLDRLIVEKFRSGNAIPVERISLTREEAKHLLSEVPAKAVPTEGGKNG